MGSGHVEKKCNHNGSGSRKAMRYLKRQSGKLMRRLWKKMQEDAPKRLPTRGWSD